MRSIFLTLWTLAFAALAALAAAPALAATPIGDLQTPSAACGQQVSTDAAAETEPSVTDAQLPTSELLTETAWGGVCDPNRQCVTDADCGQFGYCAVYRLCICNG